MYFLDVQHFHLGRQIWRPPRVVVLRLRNQKGERVQPSCNCGNGGFPELGVPVGGPQNKDYSILGLPWGPPI